MLPDSVFVLALPRAQWLKFVPLGLTTAGTSSGHEAEASPGCSALADIAPAKMDALVSGWKQMLLLFCGFRRYEVYILSDPAKRFSTPGFLVIPGCRGRKPKGCPCWSHIVNTYNNKKKTSMASLGSTSWHRTCWHGNEHLGWTSTACELLPANQKQNPKSQGQGEPQKGPKHPDT